MELSLKVPVLAYMHFKWWKEKRHRIQINLWFFPRPENKTLHVSIQYFVVIFIFFYFSISVDFRKYYSDSFVSAHTFYHFVDLGIVIHGPRTTDNVRQLKMGFCFLFFVFCSLKISWLIVQWLTHRWLSFSTSIFFLLFRRKMVNFIIHIERRQCVSHNNDLASQNVIDICILNLELLSHFI